VSNAPHLPDPAQPAGSEPKATLESRPKRPEDEDATQLGPPICVAVIEGPDRGIRKQIRGARMVIGRGEACDLRLTDASVSRRHLEVVVGAGGLVVRDLGSNNGTTVNGAKLVEAQVRHRDRIGLGATVVSIIDEYKELKEAREEQARAALRVKSVAPQAATRLPALGLGIWERVRRHRVAAIGVAGAALLAGAAAVKMGRPAAPVAAPAAAPAPAPAGEPAKDALLAALRYAEAGELEKAIASARQVEAESSRFGEAEALAAKWARALEAQRRERFKAALDAGDFDAARSLVPSLPEGERAAALEEIEAAQRRSEAQKVLERRAAGERQAEQRQEELRRARDQLDQLLAGVVRKIDDGNLRGAAGELERIAEASPPPAFMSKIRLLRRKLPSFTESYSDGAAKYAAGNLIDAAAPLLRALTLYEDMDLPGRLDASLKERTARALAARGRDAAVHGDRLAAERDYRKALRIWPELEEAADGLSKLARRAR
jgi:hypothetical protein